MYQISLHPLLVLAISLLSSSFTHQIQAVNGFGLGQVNDGHHLRFTFHVPTETTTTTGSASQKRIIPDTLFIQKPVVTEEAEHRTTSGSNETIHHHHHNSTLNETIKPDTDHHPHHEEEGEHGHSHDHHDHQHAHSHHEEHDDHDEVEESDSSKEVSLTQSGHHHHHHGMADPFRNGVLDCSASNLGTEGYNLTWHISGVFIVFGVSFLGALMTLFTRRFLTLSTAFAFTQCVKTFGSGVILATAMIHMLPEATHRLTDPCIGSSIVLDYEGFVGAIVLLGAMTTHLIQVVIAILFSGANKSTGTSKHRLHSHTHSLEIGEEDRPSPHGSFWSVSEETTPTPEELTSPVGDQNARAVPAPPPAAVYHDHGCDKPLMHLVSGQSNGKSLPLNATISSAPSSLEEAEEQQLAISKDVSSSAPSLISIILLEFGVALHSIVIGVTLGTATEEFKSLLIAFSFHQFFEGMGLAAVLVDLGSHRHGLIILMVVIYTLATPTGAAIGVALHQVIPPSSSTSLLVQGLMDGLGAGILIYDALVNVIGPHFSSKTFLKATSSSLQILQISLFWLGAIAMAIVGFWA